MRSMLFICMCLPLLLLSQNDFETRYFTIDAESLPDLPNIPSILDFTPELTGSFTLGEVPTYQEAKNASTINAKNYWQPVDIANAMKSNTISYSNKQFSVSRLQEKQFGFSISGNGGKTNFQFSDGETRVTNEVYQEQRAPFLLNPYQPFYRRNPFRTSTSTVEFGN